MLGREAPVVLSQFSRVMAEKRDKPLSQVRGQVNGQISIAVARYYSLITRGARLPSPLWERDPDWYPESGIGLAGYTARLVKNVYESRNASIPPMGLHLAPHT